MCAGNELFYVSLYLLHFASGFFSYLIGLLAVLMFPVAVVKLGIACIQVGVGMQWLGAAKMRLFKNDLGGWNGFKKWIKQNTSIFRPPLTLKHCSCAHHYSAIMWPILYTIYVCKLRHLSHSKSDFLVCMTP